MGLSILACISFALNSTVIASTGKAPFELVYGENLMVLLDYLTGATQLSHVQAAGGDVWGCITAGKCSKDRVKNRLGKAEIFF